MADIIEHYKAEAAQQGLKPARFITTGHSLGGGLAQHMLYSFPDHVEQAIVFDPSSVTAYADVDHTNQVQACACEIPALQQSGFLIEPEARILRV
jgi:pimeloyl-ACP methyl ester carboxylesterase